MLLFAASLTTCVIPTSVKQAGPHDIDTSCKDNDRLAALSTQFDANCTWTCLRSGTEPYCVSMSFAHRPVVAEQLSGAEFEGACKAAVRRRGRDRWELADTVVSTAGLFYGDWLPTLADVVGTSGRVFGFEPSLIAKQAKATAAANGLGSVAEIQHACLSSRAHTASVCVRDWEGKLLGGLQGLVQEKSKLGSKERQGKYEWARHPCGQVEVSSCVALDDELPWRTRRVGLIHLDTEGHETEGLRGAKELLRRWRPVVALEPGNGANECYREILSHLNYSRVPRHVLGKCEQLHFFEPSELARRGGSRRPAGTGMAVG